MVQQNAAGQRYTIAWDDCQTHAFAQSSVGYGVSSRLEHTGMFDRQILDVGRMDVVPAADDQVLFAPDDSQVSSLIERPQISAHEPAFGIESVLGGDLVIEIPQHEQCASCTDFPDLAR